MYQVKINGKTYHYQENKTLAAIKDELGITAYIATVNNRLRELTYYLNYDCEVKFLALDDEEACRVYQTTLRYIIAMALKRIAKDAKLTFTDYVSRSFLGTFKNLNRHYDRKFLNTLINEVEKIIKCDYPIVRVKASKEDALKIYQNEGYTDKYEVLQYREDLYVNYYVCDGFIDYMYDYMLPSTGYIKDFAMQMYAPGFIVQYPRAEEGGLIPPFADDPSFSRMIKDAQEWRGLVGIDNIASLNYFAKNKDLIRLVNMCEMKHNNMLAELGTIIKTNINDIRLICIAGPSSSGKTTFTKRLQIELMTRGIDPVMISLDDYYLNRDDTPLGEDGIPDFESIKALDIDFFNQQLVDLIQNEEVVLPVFDFKAGMRKEGRKVRLKPNQPILVEGIHALNPLISDLIPKHQKFKIFISPNPQLNIDDQNPIRATDLRLLRDRKSVV